VKRYHPQRSRYPVQDGVYNQRVHLHLPGIGRFVAPCQFQAADIFRVYLRKG